VLAEFGDSGSNEDLLERLAAALDGHEAVLAQSVEQARALWRLRESIPEAQFSNVKHDISVPVSKIPDSSRTATPRCAALSVTRKSTASATSATATCTTTSVPVTDPRNAPP
jgi:FAD/FMN-containing dehydrogenase